MFKGHSLQLNICERFDFVPISKISKGHYVDMSAVSQGHLFYH